ncbi:hypothetical protein CEXT_183151 [Caerostris extrusa]|uniref:Uncharacterized protein n=1 Tax=Caerostris extrusa TaxID=172846 RepID=A0AAV4TN06_CAEEX|nr:hypothetical protein CEXT_183151 [Caerostris extrusa]
MPRFWLTLNIGDGQSPLQCLFENYSVIAYSNRKFLMTHMIGTTPGSVDIECISSSSYLDKPIYKGSIHAPSLEKQRRPSSSGFQRPGKKSNKTKSSGNGKGKGKVRGGERQRGEEEGAQGAGGGQRPPVCPKARACSRTRTPATSSTSATTGRCS